MTDTNEPMGRCDYCGEEMPTMALTHVEDTICEFICHDCIERIEEASDEAH